jgi:hypothetical protein
MRLNQYAAAGLATFLFFFLVPGYSWAGAWLQPEGTAYVKLSGGILSTRERFDENGDRVQWDTSGGGFKNARYGDFGTLLYTETGLHRDWNVIALVTWSYLEAEQPSATSTTYGLGDITLGVKRGLWTWPRTVTSVMVLLTFPTGYDENEFPALGSGVTDLSFVASAGTSGGALWGTTELEYRFRGGDFSDQVRAVLGGGWNISSRFGLRAEARGGLSLGDEQPPSNDPRFDPVKVNPDNLDLAGTVSYTMGRGIALEGEFRTTVTGKNTLSGTRWSLAVATSPVWRWKR